MCNMIKCFYQHMTQDTRFIEGMRKEMEKDVEELLKEERQESSWQEYERHRDKAFQIMVLAEEEGFVMGFQYAVQLMAECYVDGNLLKNLNDF